MDKKLLKDDLLTSNPEFWGKLADFSREVFHFEDLIQLSSLRRKALAKNLQNPIAANTRLRLAMVGGCSLYPLHELIEHLCAMEGVEIDLWKGDYDNYLFEIYEKSSGLHDFRPEVLFLLPAETRCRYSGGLTDAKDAQDAEAQKIVQELLDLARSAKDAVGCETILANFPLPSSHDLGAFRSRSLGSDWAFKKWVNFHLGLQAPSFVHICDREFLSARIGGCAAKDSRGWFESKQPGSPTFLVELAREATQILLSLRRAPKKVLVLDLDNTLWGGVVADDGLDGIELGDTSPRGEAFKAFQKYILSLKRRGVLLAVCSKNDHQKAIEPFEKHPDMVLKPTDFVAFKANWEPKSENMRAIATDLNLGLDSLVFVDDNPAEIEIVRQFAPEVSTLLLGADPSDYADQLADARFFEPRAITHEDIQRTTQYRTALQRKTLEASATDMETYLESLQMKASLCEFTEIDVPRIAQLINKSNQFNLTTRRRSEADVAVLVGNPDYLAFTARLSDKFGDHGLISVVIAKLVDGVAEIDTWLMSCRVLKRGVEQVVLNELVRLVDAHGCSKIRSFYIPTAKNQMVRDFYPEMGFTFEKEVDNAREFYLLALNHNYQPTKIVIANRVYETR
jgi:FkbH-like protein